MTAGDVDAALDVFGVAEDEDCRLVLGVYGLLVRLELSLAALELLVEEAELVVAVDEGEADTVTGGDGRHVLSLHALHARLQPPA